MEFREAVRICLTKKYCSFKGRASRSEFWWFCLFTLLLNIAVGIVGAIAPALASIISAVQALWLLLPTLSVSTRRLHDRNLSGWWQLLPLAAAYMLLAGGLLFPRQQSLPEGGTLPRIEELTGTPGAQPPEGRGDTLRRQLPTLLCPVQLTSTQYAYDPPAGGGTVWTGQVLDMQYVHLAIPAMAGPVVRGWLSSRWGGDAWQVQEGDCPGTDLVLLVRSRDTGECPAAAITCGGRAVMYEASDGIDLSGSLPLLARPVMLRTIMGSTRSHSVVSMAQNRSSASMPR